jgi:uncharacterized protein (TIGR02118 family)
MYKLNALCRPPDHPEIFERHYAEIDAPLVRRIPGLARPVARRPVPAPSTGEYAYFLIAELHLSGRAPFDGAARSPEHRAAGQDSRQFAKDLVTLVTVSGA